MGAWALNLFTYFMIWSFTRNTAMSTSTGSATSFTTSPVSPSTDGNELSVCPKADIPVVGMCRGDSRDGLSLYLDTSLYSDQFTECSCDLAVSAGHAFVEIYPRDIDKKNCGTKIRITDLRYSLECLSTQNHATTVLNSSYALRVDIKGHGVARYCLHIQTNVTMQLNCSSGVVSGNNMASLTTSTASAQTTQLASSSPPTSLTSSASTSLSTSTSTSIPTSTSKERSPSPSPSPSTTSLTSSLMYSTSRVTSSSSTKAHARTPATATGHVVTSSTGSSVSVKSSAETSSPETESVVSTSPTSSISPTSSAKTTQKASLTTPLPLTNAPETTASVLVTTKEVSKKRPSTPSSQPSFTTLTPATSESTPSSDNNTLPDANSPGCSFPVLWVVVGIMSGILLVLFISGTLLFCRFRHQKTYDVEEEGMTSIAASIVSPEESMPHIQMLNPIYCDDPEMKSLSNYEPRPHDNVSNVSSSISEEPSSLDPSLKDADPVLNRDQTEMMQTLVTKQGRDCSKRMTYCPPGGRKGSTQGLYRL